MASDFREFEDEVLRYFQLAPPFRRLEEDLANPLGIHSWYARGLVLYYNLDDLLSLTEGEGLRLASRFRKQVFLRKNLERLRFYYRHVAHRSVAEMAAELGIAQLQVYNQLFIFNISIEDQWRKSSGNKPSLLDIGLRLRAQGVPQADILKTLEVSEDAWTSILHYTGVEPRGEAWSELEVQRLVALYQSVPVFDISLNLGRTEASISAKATELGLRHPVTRGIRDVEMAPYGRIKQDGVFQAEALEAFLWDHADRSTVELSEILGCHHTTLDRWKLRLGIFTCNPGNTRGHADPEAVAQLRSRYDQQMMVINKTINHLANTGEILTPKNTQSILGISQTKVYGTGDYAEGEDSYHLRIFDSNIQLWIAAVREIESRINVLRQVKEKSKTQQFHLENLERFSVFDILFRTRTQIERTQLSSLFDRYRPKEQERFALKIVSHLENGGQTQIEAILEGIGMSNRKRFLGQDKWGPGRNQYHLRIFDSLDHMWVIVIPKMEARIADLVRKQTTSDLTPEELEALKRLQAFSVFTLTENTGWVYSQDFSRFFDKERPREQEKLMKKIIEHIITTGKIPLVSDFQELFGVPNQRATATGNHAPGKTGYTRRVFDKTESLWLAVTSAVETHISEYQRNQLTKELTPHEDQALRRLQAFSFFDVPIFEHGEKGLSTETLQILDRHRPKEQVKLVNKILNYVISEGKIPAAQHFTKTIGITYSKCVSQGDDYGENGGSYPYRIFDSAHAMWQAVYEAAQERGLPASTLEQIQQRIDATSDREPQSPPKLKQVRKSAKQPRGKSRK